MYLEPRSGTGGMNVYGIKMCWSKVCPLSAIHGLDGTFFSCVVWLFCISLSHVKLYLNVLDKDGEVSGSRTWGSCCCRLETSRGFYVGRQLPPENLCLS